MASGTKVFISHVHSDGELAEALHALLAAAWSLNRENDILCTSNSVSGLDPGEDILEGIRLRLISAPVCIALITPAAADSRWVITEVACRWLLGRSGVLEKDPRTDPICILANGASTGDLPLAMSRNLALTPPFEKTIPAFIHKVSKRVGFDTLSEGSYRGELQRFIELAGPAHNR